MEVVANTEYQDIYRVTDGVLLVINKFTRKYPDKYIRIYKKAKIGRYKKECQEWLKVLKEEYYDEYNDITLPKGTVLYLNQPVEPSENKADLEYQIKTTGTAFSGCKSLMELWLSEILYKIRTGHIR